MEIIRKQLLSLAPFGTRFSTADDVFQVLAPDGTTWEDAPNSDPRNYNAYPPPTGGAARCDGAARMSALIAQILTTVINGLQAGLAAQLLVTTIILALAIATATIWALIPLFLAFVGAMSTIGFTNLHAAFDGFDYNGLTCKINVHLQANGQINAGGLAGLKTTIAADYAGVQETALLAVIDILGFGLLNAAAFLRTETGDCDCGYVWGHEWDFTQGSENGWTVIVAGDGKPRAVFSYQDYRPAYGFPNETRIIHNGGFPVFRFNRLELDYEITDAAYKLTWYTGNPTLVGGSPQDLIVGGKQTLVRTAVPPLYFGYLTWMRFDIGRASGSGGTSRIYAVRMWGQEAKPAFTDGTPL